MDSSSSSSDHRLFNRERTLHQILGGGFNVMLWRRKDLSVGILLVTFAAWVVFEKSGYTLLSLVSNVLLLLFTILFLWAKSADILNRPPPPLPDLQLSEELIDEAAAFLRSRVNALLSVSRDISLGKDSKLFFKIAGCMWLISIVGGWTDFLTLGYTSLVILLTVPALYEKYEDQIDRYVIMAYRELQRLYVKLDEGCLDKIRSSILEKRKLS
ncbi:Reticulon-like protein b12 [Thalictrum thalictroides]|uniref:Reticulon-like protein n=1 Tax=Thalictrum thalictroides TaxID=46969 RepID=A0A7J6WF56_THATH|nr:Reticulon-like protein b12 [Thalictrum thalictroides]